MITKNTDAIALVSACLFSHSTLWQKANDRENYILGRDTPFNDEELVENANWSSNYNFGMGLAVMQGVVKDNVSEIIRAIDFNEVVWKAYNPQIHTTEVSAFMQYEEMRDTIAEKVQNAIGTFINGDPGFATFVCKAEYQLFMFGWAACVEDMQTYLPKVAHYSEVGFEDHTRIDDIGRFVWFDSVKGDYLLSILRRIQDEPDVIELDAEEDTFITASGWNKSLLTDVLCSVFSSCQDASQFLNDIRGIGEKDVKIKYQTWEDIDLLITHKGEIWASNNLNNIYLSRIYEMEDVGVIENHVIMCCEPQGSNTLTTSQSKGIVFHKVHRGKTADSMITMLHDFGVNNSDYIHEIEGASRILARFSLRYDIRRNEHDNQCLMSQAVWVKADDSASKMSRSIDLTVKGGIVQVGESLSPTQFQPNLNLNTSLQSLAMEKSEFAELFGSYRPNVKLSNRPNKDEVKMVSEQISSVKTGDIPIKLPLYSKILTACIKRLSSDQFMSKSMKVHRERFMDVFRKEFQGDLQLTNAQISELLGLVETIRIAPVHTDPQVLGQAISISTSSNARKRFTRMMMRSLGFSSEEVRGMIDVEDYGRESEIAALENAAFETTSEVSFSRAQDHMTHLQAHFYKIDRKFRGVAAGEDPVAALNYGRNALMNTSMHVAAMEDNLYLRSKAPEMQEMQDILESNLADLAARVQKMQQQMQEQAQNGQGQGQGQMSPQLQEEFYEDRLKLEHKFKIIEARTVHAQQLAEQRQAFNERMKATQLQHNMKLSEQKANQDANNTAVKAAAKMLTP